MGHTFNHLINKAFARAKTPADYKAIAKAIRREMRTSSRWSAHWFLTNLACCYYEQRRYRTALQYDIAALVIAPNCPMVLWNYAGSLAMLGRHSQAKTIYRNILKRGLTRLATGQCGEGRSWTASFLNDCRYRLGIVHYEAGERTVAIRWLKAHLKYRSSGVRSIYPIVDVKRKLALMLHFPK